MAEPRVRPITDGASRAGPRSWPKAVSLAVSLLLTAVVAAVDLATGAELAFSIFYLGPVAFATARAGLPAGLIAAVVSAGAWLGADHLAGARYSAGWIPYWNAAVRLGFFTSVSVLYGRLHRAHERERAAASTDGLTGVLNTRGFFQAAEAELIRQRRFGRPLTLAYVDLDNFKTVNDQHGHRAGDELLRRVATILRRQIRATDAVARLGGDEFAVLLSETGAEAATVAIEKLRTSLLAAMQTEGWPVTFSFGLATFVAPQESVDAMVGRADDLMYQGKRGDKNRVIRATYGAPS
jgi:diguanylate cyclase (GGDEF)-like protein